MTSLLGNMGADWLLKRAFKFLLKKNLGSILQNEVCKAHTPLWPAPNCHNFQSWLCAGVLLLPGKHHIRVLPAVWTPECLTRCLCKCRWTWTC